jgi:hypothetical protein
MRKGAAAGQPCKKEVGGEQQRSTFGRAQGAWTGGGCQAQQALGGYILLSPTSNLRQALLRSSLLS